MRIFLLNAVLAMLFLKIAGEQRFTEVPALYTEVSAGENVKLTCRIRDKRGQCLWQKDRKPVGMHSDKYEWVDSRDGDCSLVIKRVNLDYDDGFWECQVTPSDFTQRDSLTSIPGRLLVRGKFSHLAQQTILTILLKVEIINS